MAKKQKHPDPAFEPPADYQKPPQAEWIGPYQVRVRWRRKGMPSISKVFGDWSQAWFWYEAQEAEFKLRGTVSDKRESERVTLSEAFHMWAESGEPEKRQGHKQIIERVNRLRRESLSALFVGAIRQRDIQGFIDFRARNGAARSTINNDLAVISRVFQWLSLQVGFEGLSNPCRGVIKPPQSDPVKAYLTIDDEIKLFKEIDNRTHIRVTHYLSDLCRVALLTALRQSEIKRLRWSDISLDQSWLRSVSKDPKRGTRTRNVPISPESIEFFIDLKARRNPTNDDELVFPFDIDHKKVAEQFANCVGRAGIPKITFHGLRHVAITRLAKRVSDPLKLREFSGHKTLNMLTVYYNPSASDLAAELKKL